MSKAMIKNQNNSYVLNAKKKLLKVILNHIETKQFKQKEIQELFNIKFTQTNKKNNQYYFATQHIKSIKIAAWKKDL